MVDIAKLEEIGRDLLIELGYDPTATNIADTPRRFARLWQEFICYDGGSDDTTFESAQTDQMVVVSGMRVWSMCEHHLLPFWCDVSVGYLTGAKVLGLSKFARIAHTAAHRLQLQERLVTDIADRVQEVTETQDVAVIAVGEHLCMTMRGVKTPAKMTSSVMRGRFWESEATRLEFLTLTQTAIR
jgi:GTP cyclohydrolase I